MTTSDEDGNENDTRLSQVPQVRIIREEQQRGLIHLHVLCPQVMHFVNRSLHIQAAAQPPTPADKLAMAHAAQQKWPRKATAVCIAFAATGVET